MTRAGDGNRTHVRTSGGVKRVPTSLPRGPTNLRPVIAISTVSDQSLPKGELTSRWFVSDGASREGREGLGAYIHLFSNPQLNPQNAPSCTTYAVFGSPRGLVCCCKT